MASWSGRFSFWNCRWVTWVASPRWRVMASKQRQRGAVVHQAGAQADSPQRGGADLLRLLSKSCFAR